LATTLIPACQSGSTGPSQDATATIGTYAGTWTQNGTSGTFDAEKSLTIGADLSYVQTVHQYESPAKLTLAFIKVVTGTVTAISVDDANEAYDTIFVGITAVEVTPKTAGQADEWNTAAYGGITAWTPDVTQTFNSSNPGLWEHGAVWLDHVAVSVQREGDLLNVNERGGFDGQDPPEDVYFLGE
jgi:hypothetical protein